jgi:hypothetical protein
VSYERRLASTGSFRKLALLLEMRDGNNGAALVGTGLQLCQTTEESFVAGTLSMKRLHGIPTNELLPFRTESQA